MQLHLPAGRYDWRARYIRLGLLLLTALLASACRGRPPATPTPAPVTPGPEAIGEVNGTLPGAGQRQLVVWLPAFSGIAADDAAGDVLETAIFQFQQANPGVRVDVQVKAESGAAGLWPFLRAAQAVAPAVLPDLVLINTQHLWQGAELGLFVALRESELGAVDDFYPAATAGVRHDAALLGIPYVVDVVHAIYSQEGFEGALPTWEALLAAGSSYLFPGAANEGLVNLHAVAQYVGAGGDISAGAAPDLEAAQAYFEFLAGGRLEGVIPPEAEELSSFAAVYASYRQNPSGLAAVLGHDVLAGADAAELRYAPLPTRTGRAVPIAETWAFAIVTQEAERRDLALALVAAFLEPDVQGAWSQFADRLPSRRGALAEWEQSGPYRRFLEQQIESAQAIPNGRAFADFARRLQAGQAAVLRGDLTPNEAARNLGVVP